MYIQLCVYIYNLYDYILLYPLFTIMGDTGGQIHLYPSIIAKRSPFENHTKNEANTILGNHYPCETSLEPRYCCKG